MKGWGVDFFLLRVVFSFRLCVDLGTLNLFDERAFACACFGDGGGSGETKTCSTVCCWLGSVEGEVIH